MCLRAFGGGTSRWHQRHSSLPDGATGSRPRLRRSLAKPACARRRGGSGGASNAAAPAAAAAAGGSGDRERDLRRGDAAAAPPAAARSPRRSARGMASTSSSSSLTTTVSTRADTGAAIASGVAPVRSMMSAVRRRRRGRAGGEVRSTTSICGAALPLLRAAAVTLARCPHAPPAAVTLAQAARKAPAKSMERRARVAGRHADRLLSHFARRRGRQGKLGRARARRVPPRFKNGPNALYRRVIPFGTRRYSSQLESPHGSLCEPAGARRYRLIPRAPLQARCRADRRRWRPARRRSAREAPRSGGHAGTSLVRPGRRRRAPAPAAPAGGARVRRRGDGHELGIPGQRRKRDQQRRRVRPAPPRPRSVARRAATAL